MSDSAEWLHHFEANRTQLLEIPWHLGPDLSPAARAAVAGSLAEFQRGESSEGRHLIRYAEAYARAWGDPDYVPAIRLFIAEEQRHARDLGRFLTMNGVPLAKRSFADAVFRRLRNLVGSLEASIAVLILAEIIAQVYYTALRKATDSVVLGRLCDQIIRDEAFHVRFQAELLGKLRARRGRALLAATMLGQRLLFAGTCMVVWCFHARALRRGGFGLVDFRQSARHHFNRAFAISGDVRDAWLVRRSFRSSVGLAAGPAPRSQSAPSLPPTAPRTPEPIPWSGSTRNAAPRPGGTPALRVSPGPLRPL